MKDWSDLQSVRLLGTLVAHRVDFVVVGGIAVVLHGSARVTKDIDIVYAPGASNVEALGKALAELEARLVGIDEDLPFVPDARTLARTSILTLETVAGRLDLLREPSGAPTYVELREQAEEYDVGPFRVRVATIPHLVAMKRAAGRPQDLVDAVELEAIARIRAECGL